MTPNPNAGNGGPRIVSATISAMPTDLMDPMPVVTATFDDGTAKELFSYYPNEISFKPEDFAGLTERQARALRHERDVAYLMRDDEAEPGQAGRRG